LLLYDNLTKNKSKFRKPKDPGSGPNTVAPLSPPNVKELVELLELKSSEATPKMKGQSVVDNLPPAPSLQHFSINKPEKSFDFADFAQNETVNAISHKTEIEHLSNNIQQLKLRKEELATIKSQSRQIDLSKSLVLLDSNCYLHESVNIFRYIENSTFKVILPLAGMLI
jgi:hypothetical protein